MNRASNPRYFFLLVLFLHSITGRCCINEYRALLNDHMIVTDAGNAAPHGRFFNKTYLLKQLAQADSIYKRTNEIEDYSDYGVMLLYNGQYNEGKQVFQNIELKKPGLYATAANLGTAYELLGMNDSAYFWITTAIQINPDSHYGSEWIHAKILAAKLSAASDPQYFSNHSILSLDFGDDAKPENSSHSDLQKLHDQLYYQLGERMSFIAPKDPVVAQLLFDLGNVTALSRDLKSALQIYEVAKKYGYTSEVMEKRITYFKSRQRMADLRNSTEIWARRNTKSFLLIVAACFTASVAGIVLIVKRIRRKRATS